jgi:micrococcal nuclease
MRIFLLFVLVVFPVTLLGEELTVSRVIDGDTIVAGEKKIRFIGVNTPELRPLQPYGKEAKLFVVTIIQKNKNKVRVETDGQQVDRYRRNLYHVYVGEELISEKLLLLGYAKAETKYRYSKSFKKRFIKAEKIAKEKKLGIWGK